MNTKSYSRAFIFIVSFFFAILNLSAKSAPDFNGDFISDLGQVWNDNGSLSVSAMTSDGASFTEQKWVNQTGSYSETQRWFYGDFNGDGISDAAVLWDDGGSMSCDVYISTDTNSDFMGDSFVKQSWATQSGPFNYADRWYVADFDGDFKTDLARVYNDTEKCSIDVYLANYTADGFEAPSKWANKQRDFEGDNVWLTGDFNGDFATDFAVVEAGDVVNIMVHLSNGSGFNTQTWNNTVGRLDSMKWVAADFTGDGMTDIGVVYDALGTVETEVYISNGTAFVYTPFTSGGNFVREHKWLVGDFDGDTIFDLAYIANQGGQTEVTVYSSDGASAFTPTTINTFGRAYKDQDVYMVGDFDGDFADDIAIMLGDSNNWTIDVLSTAFGSSTQFSSLSLGDYFDRHNLAPEVNGDKFVNHNEIRGATPPGADLQAVLDSGADLELVQRAVYNQSETLYYKASYQGIRTYDAEFIGDYAIVRMQIDLGEFDTLIDGNRNSFVHLENVTVDGNKYTLGQKLKIEGIGQGALCFFAYAEGVWINRCVFYNTRTWSTVHLPSFGDSHSHIAEHCYVLGAGNGPRGNGRDLGELGNNVPGGTGNTGWADGFSISASNVKARDNFFMDCTDVALVLFGAPGSHVYDNMMFNYSRECLGSINLVDASGFRYLGDITIFGETMGRYDYRGDIIENNRIAASGARIQMGIPFGTKTWKPADPDVFDIDGGVIRNNHLEGGAFGYGYILDYVMNLEFYGNTSSATHSGKGQGSGGNGNDPDPATAFLWDQNHVTIASGATFQGGFTQATKEIEHLLYMNGAPQNTDGYKYYAYADPEIDTTIEASYLEMLGRLPSPGDYADHRPKFNYGTGFTIDTDYIGDYLRRELMLLPEFIDKFGAIGPENLHVFRTSRWRDRIMANDQSEIVSTGNYPDPKVVYDNVLSDLVHPGSGNLDATITSISPSLPAYMVQDQIVNISVTVRNEGSTTWVNSAGNPAKFALASVGDDTTFGVTRVYLPSGVSVANGQSHTFNLEIIAPPVAWAGEGQPTTTSFPYDFRMIQESVSYFGDAIADYSGGTHMIEVENAPEPPPAPFYNSIFVSQELQGDPHINDIRPGEEFAVSITLKNAGNYTTAPWTSDIFRLGSENSRDNQTWGTNRAFMDNNAVVAHGETYTFNRILTAPLAEGTYDFQWMMLGDGVGWFGAKTQNLQITVSNTAPLIELNDANFVSINVPDQVLWNDAFDIDLTFENIGESTWAPGTNFKLGNIQGAVDRTSEPDATITYQYPDDVIDQDLTYSGYLDPFDNDSTTKYFTNNSSAWVQYQFGNGNQREITKYAVVSAPDEGPGPNLINNGSFDSNANGWTLSNATRVTSESVSGGASLRLRRTSIGNLGNTRQTINGLKLNTDYMLTFWIKQEAGTQGNVVIDSQDVFDAEMQVVNGGGQPTVWTKFTRVFNTYNLATSMTFRIFGSNFMGTAYIDEISIVEIGGGAGAGDPASWTLQGSNNGTNWTTVDSRSGVNFPNRSQRLEFDVTNSGSYEYYRFNASNNSGTVLQYSELELLTEETDNIWTGSNRVTLPGGTSVAPGGTHTFTLNLTAPGVVGNYNFMTRMLQENVAGQGWFGDYSPSQTIFVTDTPPPFNDSEFVSQVVPTEVKPGANFVASVTLKNTGNLPWSIDDVNGGYKLGSENPQGNTTWGRNRLNLPSGVVVNPNQNYTFEIVCTAPLVEGLTNMQWRMVQEGVQWFGALSDNAVINVHTAAPDVDFDDATFVSQEMPSKVFAGNEFQVKVTYTNSGTTTWTAGGNYQLGSENSTGNSTWGVSLVNMDGAATVLPGENYEFVFNLTAPSTPGTYNSQWRLNVPSRGRFGEFSGNVAVSVEVAPAMGTNLVKNGSFELGGAFPTDWNLGNNTVGSNEQSQDGSSALKLSSNPGNNRQTIQIETNTDYQLSIWVLASGMTLNNIHFDTNDRFDAGQAPNGACQWNIDIGEADVWTQFVGNFNSGLFTEVTIRTYGSDMEGVVFFDNIELVEVVADPYEAWKTANGVTLDNGDDDGDGISNLMEFALGGNPNSEDATTKMPTVARNGSNLEFTFDRMESSVTYTVEKSTDLATWTDFDTDPGSVGGSVTVSVPDTEMLNGKLFLRLKVE